MTSTEDVQSPSGQATAATVDTPAIRGLRETATAAKLRKEQAEAEVGRIKAYLPGEFPKSSVEGDKTTTGLTGVAVTRAFSQLAEHVAEQAQKAVIRRRRGRRVRLVVTSDTRLLDASGARQVILLRLAQLTRTMDALLGPPPDPVAESTRPGRGPDEFDLAVVGLLPGAAAAAVATPVAPALAALASVVPAAVELFTRVTAHSYMTAGQAVGAVENLGFDLDVADKFRDRRPDADVRIARLGLRSGSPLLSDVAALADRTANELADRITEVSVRETNSAAELARTAATLEVVRSRVAELVKSLSDRDDPAPSPLLVELDAEREREMAIVLSLARRDRASDPIGNPDQDEASDGTTLLTGQLEAVRGRILELIKGLASVTDIGGPTTRTQLLERELRTEAALLADLTALQHRHATDAAELTPLVKLRAEVADFLTGLTTSTGSDAMAPLVAASDIDALLDPAAAPNCLTVILYARLTSAGTDTVVDDRAVLTDRRTVLTGVSAEYALLSVDGELLDGGTATTFLSWVMPLKDIERFEEHRPRWGFVDRTVESDSEGARRSDGADPSSTR